MTKMDLATAKYLEENVGGVLAKALADMSVQQPSDGVAFLAQWLKTYAEQEEAKVTRLREDKILEAEREKVKAQRAALEAIRQTRLGEQKALEDTYQVLVNKFCNPDVMWEDNFWNELVDVSKAVSGAEAGYIGLLNETDEQFISYERASHGSEWMLDSTLPKDKGVTWGAWLENPDEEAFKAACLWKPPSVRAVPSEPVEEGGEPPKDAMSYYPVCIPSVTDVKGVHYFRMTRLGAFLALPLIYTTYYTSDALADAKAFEEEKKAEAKRRAEAAAAAAAAEAAGEEPKPEEPPAEEKTLVLRGKVVKMVLCLDSLGLNTSFEEPQILQALELCKAAGQRKSQSEMNEVDAQALIVIDEAHREKQLAEVAAAREAAHDHHRQALAQAEALLAEGDEPAKDAVAKAFAFERARHVAKELTAMILALKSWVVVPAEVPSVLAGAALICGAPLSKLYDKRNVMFPWDRLKHILDASLIDELSKVKIADERTGLAPEHKLSFWKKLAVPEGLDEEKALAISPAFQVLFVAVQAACQYRVADLELRRAKYNAYREQVIAENTTEDGVPGEFTGPALTELDDDYVE